VEEWFHAFLNLEVGEVNNQFHAPVILKPAKQRTTVTTESEKGGAQGPSLTRWSRDKSDTAENQIPIFLSLIPFAAQPPQYEDKTPLLYLCNVFASNVSATSQKTLNTERLGALGVLRRNRTSHSRPGISFKIQIYQLSFFFIFGCNWLH
jgi:hypothetical protein